MQEDLLNKWFCEADLKHPPLERPAKRRRLDKPDIDASKQPPAPSISRRARSIGCPAITTPASPSPYKPVQEGYWNSLDLPAARRRWLNRFRDTALPQEQEGSGLHSFASPGFRRSQSDSGVLYTRRHIQFESSPTADMSMPPPTPAATSEYRNSIPALSDRGRTSSRSGRSEVTGGSSQTGRIDATNTNYRAKVLKRNGIYILNATAPLSAELAAEADHTRRRRDSPGLSDQLAAEICGQILMRGDDEESSVEGLLPEKGILPRDRRDDPRSHQHLRYIRRMPYSKAFPLPKAIKPNDFAEEVQSNIQSIVIPSPDIAYGYTLEGFSSNQRFALGCTIRGVDLDRLSMPAKDLLWPFLIVEFKALPTGGNIYWATNQCAGGGAVSVKATQSLYALASQFSEGFSDPMEAVAYSAAIDGELAIMYMHWFDDGQYYMERINIYLLSRPAELIQFRKQVRNILDWAFSTRLDMIKSALDVVSTSGHKGIKRPISPPAS